MRLTAAIAIAVSLICTAGAAAQRTAPRILSLVDVFAGTDEHDLRWPVAVAAAAPDTLAVADVHQPRLLVLQRVGVTWSVERSVELPAAPAGLAWQMDRWVLSLRGRSDLLVLQGTGETTETIELPTGAAPGLLAATPGGELLVWEAAGSAILRIGRGGRILATTTIDGIATGLDDDGAGGFLVALGDRSRLVHYDAAGQETAAWDLPSDGPVPAWPAGVAVEPGGRAFVVDRRSGRILVLDRSGRWIGFGSRMGEDPGLLKQPAGLARIPDGSLLVADPGNGRVQIFRLSSEGDDS